MSAIRYFARISSIISLIALLAGCIVTPAGGYHEGYYDHAHHRWWHNHGWVDCGGGDPHCH
jgi:hypothetical protein